MDERALIGLDLQVPVVGHDELQRQHLEQHHLGADQRRDGQVGIKTT